ncbi:hypothetical protein ACJJTC_017675 [Scirpophaga incertulas]
MVSERPIPWEPRPRTPTPLLPSIHYHITTPARDETQKKLIRHVQRSLFQRRSPGIEKELKKYLMPKSVVVEGSYENISRYVEDFWFAEKKAPVIYSSTLTYTDVKLRRGTPASADGAGGAASWAGSGSRTTRVRRHRR